MSASAGAGLALHISSDKASYSPRGRIVLEVSLVNTGKRQVEIDRRIDPAAHVQFEFRNAAGRKVKSKEVRVQLALSKDKRDFLQLDPGYVYGVHLFLSPRRSSRVGGTEYYSLIYPPTQQIDQKFFLSSPGHYSVTAVYEGVDDGHMAGVRAWTGSLKSNRISFVISP